MQNAIETRIIGPTNNKGTRVIAASGDRRKTFSYDYSLSAQANHETAARAILWLKNEDCQKGTTGVLISGWSKNGMSHLFHTFNHEVK